MKFTNFAPSYQEPQKRQQVMDETKLPRYIDIVFCLVLLPLMIMLLPVEKWFVRHPLFVVMFVIWLYGVYFLNRRVTAPLILVRKKYLWALVIVVLTIFVTYLISQYPLGGHHLLNGPYPRNEAVPYPHPRHPSPIKLRMHQQGIWLLFVVVTVFSHSVGLLAMLNIRTLEKKELEQEKQKAELALYKAQINPHFLFNTLNTLYGLLITGSDKAEAAFMQFTGIVKYMYSNPSKDTIPLTEEAEYISRYIGLQKLRLNSHTEVTFDSRIDNNSDAQIVPMLLITFVENAFKFGVSSHIDTKIDIRLVSGSSRIYFEVKNDVVKDALKNSGDGIGIKNCKERLELIYATDYTLGIEQTGGYYLVRLDIPATLPVKNSIFTNKRQN